MVVADEVRTHDVDEFLEVGDVVGVAELFGRRVVREQVDDGFLIGGVPAERVDDGGEDGEFCRIRLVGDVPSNEIFEFRVIFGDLTDHFVDSGDVFRMVQTADAGIVDFPAQSVAAEETQRGLVGFRVAAERNERDSGRGNICDDLRLRDEFPERSVEIRNVESVHSDLLCGNGVFGEKLFEKSFSPEDMRSMS